MVTIKEKVFANLTQIDAMRGGKTTWACKIFWYIYKNPSHSFNQIKHHFGIGSNKSTIISRPLNKLVDEHVVVKRKGKYYIAPLLAKGISPFLSLEYIIQNQPSIYFLNFGYDEKTDMNIHMLYGFSQEEDDLIIKTIIEQINTSFNVLRRLKALQDDKESNSNITMDAFVYSLCQLFSLGLYRLLSGPSPYLPRPDEIPDFLKKLVDKSMEITKEMNPDSPTFFEDSLLLIRKDIDEFYKDIPRKKRVTDTKEKKSRKPIDYKLDLEDYPASCTPPQTNNIAIISVPSFAQSKPTFFDESPLQPQFLDPEDIYNYMKAEYGESLKYYHLLPLAKKIRKMGVIIWGVNISIEHDEQLPLTMYEFYNADFLERERKFTDKEITLIDKKIKFTDKEIDFMWTIIKNYHKEGFFIPALLRVIWYGGLNSIWKDEKKSHFKKYYGKMKKLMPEEHYGVFDEKKLKEFEHEDIAFEVMEYCLGEETISQIEKEKENDYDLEL